MIRHVRVPGRHHRLVGCMLAISLLGGIDCAGPNRIYPKRGSQLVGPCCTSVIAYQKPRVVVSLVSGERITGRLTHVECRPETSIVIDFSQKRGMFRIADEPESIRVALHDINSISSLEPRTNALGVAMAITYIGIVVLALTLAPLWGPVGS
jgi:hypothetical protein